MRSATWFTIGSIFSLALLDAGSVRAQNTLAIQRVGSDFARPVFVTAPAGETNRLFVVEQRSGLIRILDAATGTIQSEAFLRVTGLTGGGEQGLLGMAFHPGYATNGFFYVNYTTTGGGQAGHTEITRYRALGDPATSNQADPDSKTVLLTYPQPESNHNAGWLGFGTDGYLYISSGDGGGGDDRHGPIGNGQNINTLLGKILRLDVDQGAPYSIPDGNPFKGATDGLEEIWAFGLRNPWRCSIDRLTGDLWIGDVGQGAREEIDFNPAGVGGLNFGWRPREGLIQNPSFPNETPVTPATDPVHDYPRSSGFSVTGGYVYRGQAIPSFQGEYLFADYGTARFWSFRYDGTVKSDVVERTSELNSGTPKPIGNVSSFGEDGQGELYICDLDDGDLFKIVPVQGSSTGITLLDAKVSGETFEFQFVGVPGQSYVVESSESVTPPAWQTVTNLTATATSTNLVVTDAVRSAERFYRVRNP